MSKTHNPACLRSICTSHHDYTCQFYQHPSYYVLSVSFFIHAMIQSSEGTTNSCLRVGKNSIGTCYSSGSVAIVTCEDTNILRWDCSHRPLSRMTSSVKKTPQQYIHYNYTRNCSSRTVLLTECAFFLLCLSEFTQFVSCVSFYSTQSIDSQNVCFPKFRCVCVQDCTCLIFFQFCLGCSAFCTR